MLAPLVRSAPNGDIVVIENWFNPKRKIVIHHYTSFGVWLTTSVVRIGTAQEMLEALEIVV